jgi:hypothetical protein
MTCGQLTVHPDSELDFKNCLRQKFSVKMLKKKKQAESGKKFYFCARKQNFLIVWFFIAKPFWENHIYQNYTVDKIKRKLSYICF